MIYKFLIAACIGVLPVATHAQFGNIGNKIKSKATQRVDAKIDKAIDQGLDKAEGKTVASNDTKAKDERTVSSSNNNETKTPNKGINSFSKYDFIAGEKVIYYENFEQDAIGELPTNWNTTGTGEVVTLDNVAGKWLRIHHPFNYLSGNEKELGDNYTVELDMILQLKSNGWMFPTISFGIISSDKESTTSNDLLKGFEKYNAIVARFNPSESERSSINIESAVDNSSYFKSDLKPIPFLENYYGKPVHVAIQVQKERYRIWVNEVKAFDVPKGVSPKYKMNQLLIQAGGSNYKDDQYALYIGNIKIAQGLPDTRHKLLEEGKFSTTAILFDVNTADIQPQSTGVLREIANVLSEHKDIKIMIVGHTDSDGADAANITLSQKRAAAVKASLANDYGVSEERIETSGKGESQPVADNKSAEGKAQNRRVEFIRL